MRETRAQEILAGLTPEVRAERQRITDAAVRAARDSGHCDTFNEMIALVLPEMIVDIDGYRVALDSEGGCCRSRPGQTAWAYYYGESGTEVDMFDPITGYSIRTGRDRDGFDGAGFDSDGFDANNMGRSRSRVQRRTRWTEDDGTERTQVERWYQTGYGEYTLRDAEGNLRVGRPATPEEEAEEAEKRAEYAARYEGRFNPTTWQPTVSDSPSE